jgi:hypothetical protein
MDVLVTKLIERLGIGPTVRLYSQSQYFTAAQSQLLSDQKGLGATWVERRNSRNPIRAMGFPQCLLPTRELDERAGFLFMFETLALLEQSDFPRRHGRYQQQRVIFSQGRDGRLTQPILIRRQPEDSVRVQT